MKKIVLIVTLALFCLASYQASAGTFIVRNGKASGRILAADTQAEQDAAFLLQDFVKRLTGAEAEVLPLDSKAKKGDVVILGVVPESGLTEDAFSVNVTDGRTEIVSGGGNGSSYAVVTLLENWFGVRYYAADALYYDTTESLSLPDGLSFSETPTFRYRQTQSYSLALDPLYKVWFRLEQPNEAFAGNLWVHTFNHILPASVYGKEHPDWYSFIGGEHRPGKGEPVVPDQS